MNTHDSNKLLLRRPTLDVAGYVEKILAIIYAENPVVIDLSSHDGNGEWIVFTLVGQQGDAQETQK
jgi:hypothetical protein